MSALRKTRSGSGKRHNLEKTGYARIIERLGLTFRVHKLANVDANVIKRRSKKPAVKQAFMEELDNLNPGKAKPVLHPGRIFARLLLRNAEVADIARVTGVDASELSEFAAGQRNMTKALRDKLRPVYGEAANNLFRIQENYDFFQEHGHRPPPRLRGLS